MGPRVIKPGQEVRVRRRVKERSGRASRAAAAAASLGPSRDASAGPGRRPPGPTATVCDWPLLHHRGWEQEQAFFALIDLVPAPLRLVGTLVIVAQAASGTLRSLIKLLMPWPDSQGQAGRVAATEEALRTMTSTATLAGAGVVAGASRAVGPNFSMVLNKAEPV